MNDNQKSVCLGVVAVVVGMALYPPFVLHWFGRTATEYGWIFSPPFNGAATVDVGRLIAQWVAVLGVGAVAFVLLRNRS